ncbi:hypothetical protein [Photobacterium sp. TLY01]|nr:hypothetical protein [Photobacterium sp. TLY01]
MGKSAEDGFFGGSTEENRVSGMSQLWETGSQAEHVSNLIAYFLS